MVGYLIYNNLTKQVVVQKSLFKKSDKIIDWKTVIEQSTKKTLAEILEKRKSFVFYIDGKKVTKFFAKVFFTENHSTILFYRYYKYFFDKLFFKFIKENFLTESFLLCYKKNSRKLILFNFFDQFSEKKIFLLKIDDLEKKFPSYGDFLKQLLDSEKSFEVHQKQFYFANILYDFKIISRLYKDCKVILMSANDLEKKIKNLQDKVDELEGYKIILNDLWLNLQDYDSDIKKLNAGNFEKLSEQTNINNSIALNEFHYESKEMEGEIDSSKTTPGKKVILIVEDDQITYAYLELIIKQNIENAVVLKAINGNEAVKLALSNPVDLIFLDYKLPMLDGLSVANILKQKKVRSRIVLITGFIDDVKNFLNFDDFVEKPFTKEQIIEKLKKYI